MSSPATDCGVRPSVSLISAGTDHTICFLDRQTGRQLRRLAGHEGAIVALALSRDGRTLASASEDGTARLWDGATGQERHCLRGHDKYAWAVVFTPDGYVLTVSSILLDTQDLRVHLADGTRYHGRMVAVEPEPGDGRTIDCFDQPAVLDSDTGRAMPRV